MCKKVQKVWGFQGRSFLMDTTCRTRTFIYLQELFTNKVEGKFCKVIYFASDCIKDGKHIFERLTNHPLSSFQRALDHDLCHLIFVVPYIFNSMAAAALLCELRNPSIERGVSEDVVALAPKVMY